MLLHRTEDTVLSDDATCRVILPDSIDFKHDGAVMIEVWDGGRPIFQDVIMFRNGGTDVNFEFAPISANMSQKGGGSEKVALGVSDFFGSNGAKIRSDTQYIDFCFRTVATVPDAPTASQETTAYETQEAPQLETSPENDSGDSKKPATETGSGYSLVIILLSLSALVLSAVAIIVVLKHRK